jgi:hypothetical protein
MATNMNLITKLKSFLWDKNGKPIIWAWIVTFVIGLTVLIAVSLLFSSGKEKKASGDLKLNYNLPDAPEERKINLDQKDTYVTYDQMLIKLQEDLPGIIRAEMDDTRFMIDQYQQDMLNSQRGQALQLEDKLRSEFSSSQQDFEDRMMRRLSELNSSTSGTPGNDLQGTGFGSTPYSPSLVYSGNDNVSSSTGFTNTTGVNSSTGDPRLQMGNSAILFDSFSQSANSLLVNEGAPSQLSYRIGKGIDAGTFISGILKTGCVVSSGKSPVLVTVVEDVTFNNTVVIPKDSYFIGYGQADLGVRQVFITLEKLVLKNNREVDVKAHLIDEKNQPGFCTKFIDKTMRTMWLDFGLNFSAGLLSAFKDTFYIISAQGLPMRYEAPTVKNAAIDGLTAGVTGFSSKLMSDAERLGFIIYVKDNLKVKVFVDEKILLEQLGINIPK